MLRLTCQYIYMEINSIISATIDGDAKCITNFKTKRTSGLYIHILKRALITGVNCCLELFKKNNPKTINWRIQSTAEEGPLFPVAAADARLLSGGRDEFLFQSLDVRKLDSLSSASGFNYLALNQTDTQG